MSTEKNEPDYVFEQVKFDGSEASWKDILNAANTGIPGDLFVLFNLSSLNLEAVVNLSAVTGLITDLDGNVFYKNVSVIAPPEDSNFSVAEGNLGSLRATGVDAIELDDCEIDSLREALRSQADRSVVIISGLNRFRGKVAEKNNSRSVSSWTGLSHRMTTKDKRHFAPLCTTVEMILNEAKSRQLFVIADCNASLGIGDEIDKALGSPDSFYYGGFQQDSLSIIEKEIENLAVLAIQDPKNLGTAISEIDRLELEPSRKALAKNQILYACGHFEAAWAEIEPFLNSLKNESVEACLNLGHCALATGRGRDAGRWLDEAVSTGIHALEDLHRGYLLARELDNDSICEMLLGRLTRLFPKQRMTLQLRYRHAVKKRNYTEAAKIAGDLELPIERRQWELLSEPTPSFDDLEKLYEVAKAEDIADRYAITIAREMRARSDPDSALYWANKVDLESIFTPDAFVIRIWAFGKGVLHNNGVGDSDVDEFIPLLSYVAANPTKRSLRFALEDMIEDQLSEVITLSLLGTVLMRLISDCSGSDEFAEESLKGEIPEPSAVFSFIKAVFKEIGGEAQILGTGRLSDKLAEQVNQELIMGFLIIVEESKISPGEIQYAYMLLRVADLICHAAKDPSSDLIAAQLIVQRLARAGEMQVARNIGEEVLRVFPDRQAEYREWRTGMCWTVYAEAHQCAGNHMGALLTLCLGFSSFCKQTINSRAIGDALRISIRVMRDLHLIPMALHALKVEREIRERTDHKNCLVQLDQVELSLKTKAATSSSEYLELLQQAMQQLRDLPKGFEKLPVASLAVSIVRNLTHEGIQVPDCTIKKLDSAIKADHGEQTSLLLSLLHGGTTKNDLIRIAKSIGNAIRREDIAGQSEPLRILAEDAIGGAVQNGDVDLFLAAVALQCQPALTLAAMDSGDNQVISNRFRNQIFENLSAALSTDHYKNQLDILSNLDAPEEYGLEACCAYGVDDLTEVLEYDEQAVIVACGAGDKYFLCAVKNNGSTQMLELSSESWNWDNLLAWKHTGKDHSQVKHDFENTDLLDAMAKSLSNLSLEVSSLANRVIIIPGADLFDLPFSFIGSNDGMLGQKVQLSVAPSVGWLRAIRKRSHKKIDGNWTAWLGSSLTRDNVLLQAREKLGPELKQLGLRLIEGHSLHQIEDAGMVIFINHGVQGHLNQFHSVTDGEDHYGPGEVAAALNGCPCVVLCVCHGTSASAELGTSELRGLLAALLASGIRTVVGSPWRISLDVLQHWLPRFLKEAQSGLCIGDSVSAANGLVSQKFKGTHEWACMQVYGDARLKMYD